MDQRVVLLGWIRSIVRDEHVAEDIFQEVAIVAIDKHGEIRDEQHFPCWARKVAMHKALKVLRDAKRLPVVLDESLLTLIESHWQNLESVASIDLMKALRECRTLLSPYGDELIRLRHERGLSGAAIAEALQREVNTVYVALSRTYRTLAACIRRRIAKEIATDG